MKTAVLKPSSAAIAEARDFHVIQRDSELQRKTGFECVRGDFEADLPDLAGERTRRADPPCVPASLEQLRVGARRHGGIARGRNPAGRFTMIVRTSLYVSPVAASWAKSNDVVQIRHARAA